MSDIASKLTATACAVIFGCSLCLAGTASPADTSDVEDVRRYWSAGSRLLAAGEPRLAADELRKALVLAGESAPAGLRLDLARAAYHAGDSAAALGALTLLPTPCGTRDWCLDAELIRLKSYLALDDLQHGAAQLQSILASPGLPVGLQPRLKLVSANVMAQAGRTAAARDELLAVRSHPDADESLRTAAVAAADEVAGLETRPFNPALAGWLSVIPGAGQLYSGHGKAAVAAFLMNSALAALTHDAWRKGREIPRYGDVALAGWGVLFGVFYAANIENAVSLAAAANDADRRARLGRMADLGYRQFLEE